nr:Surface protein Rib [Streptococcus thermophilus]
MKITMRALALATATALLGAGISAPTTPIATAQTTAGKTPVGGLTWPAAETGFGGEVRIVPQGTPKGEYQFSVNPEYEGFKLSVDTAGVVTVKAPVNKETNSRKWIEFPITVNTTNGRHVGSYKVEVTAKQELNEHKAVWTPVTMRGNETATARQTASVPAGTTFKIRHDLNPRLRDTVEATINKKGDVTVRPKGNLLPGRFTVAVEVAFPNGNTQLETLYFTISQQGQWQRDKATITYPNVTTPAKKAGTAAPTKKNVPAGTTFKLGDVPSGWTASVDRSTGVVTAKAPANSGRGAWVEFSVMATFPDSSQKASQVRFTVGDSSRTTPKPSNPKPSNPAPSGDGSDIDGSSSVGVLLGVLALLGAAGAAIVAFMQNNGGIRLPF